MNFQFGRIDFHFIVYKDLLLAFSTYQKELYVEILNLESTLDCFNCSSYEIEIGLSITETPEKSHLRSKFMNKEGSGITFKIGSQEIPAHKEILIQKSEYFQPLFESGLSESKQHIIEVKDCEFLTFRGFDILLSLLCLNNNRVSSISLL